MSNILTRLPTSKARGVCKYYNHPRGCWAGDKCKFLHEDPDTKSDIKAPSLTPYDKAKVCRYFANGYCKKGRDCWFRHVTPDDKGKKTENEDREDELLCSICFEHPVTYGLLSGCSHVFCISCIKQWRDSEGKAGEMVFSRSTKKCPMCRTLSRFITPSSRFWKEGSGEKKDAIQRYKDCMARVRCRYFDPHSPQPKCRFGNECFYHHVNVDGTPFVFKHSIGARKSPDVQYSLNLFPNWMAGRGHGLVIGGAMTWGDFFPEVYADVDEDDETSMHEHSEDDPWETEWAVSGDAFGEDLANGTPWETEGAVSGDAHGEWEDTEPLWGDVDACSF